VGSDSFSMFRILFAAGVQDYLCGQLYHQDGEVEGSEAVMVGLRTARNAA